MGSASKPIDALWADEQSRRLGEQSRRKQIGYGDGRPPTRIGRDALVVSFTALASIERGRKHLRGKGVDGIGNL